MATPPAKACVKKYPLVVKNKWVFVWMGDAEKADQDMLPDNFSCDHPDWVNVPGYMHYDTPYLLIADNLLDFSHLSYVHENTLGGSVDIALAKPTVEVIDAKGQRGVKVSRFIPDVPAPPYYTRFRKFDSNLDRWFVYDFLFPSTLLMNSGGRPVGDAPDDNSRAVVNHSCQTLTPETETSTHYFFQQSHKASLKDESVRHNMYNTLLEAFGEDRDMISAQFKNLSSNAIEEMLPLHFDSALVRFRKLLSEAVNAEK
jgi:vanillate O-demethylase monooxygenase subunit